ncbi:DUF1064 domain-containing protein [Chlorobium sp.]|uniref:DUF1064 domain-containing protein n=1 Tax=Chlorobium sp. TaxID=1095 RepID=UPI003C5F14A5
MSRERYYARALNRTGRQTKTQIRYSLHLAAMKQAGEIVEYWEEPFNVKIADGAYYKVDFMVQRFDGILELHEVKGALGVIEEKALLKAKVVASRYPFRMIMTWPRKGGGWEYRNFSDSMTFL